MPLQNHTFWLLVIINNTIPDGQTFKVGVNSSITYYWAVKSLTLIDTGKIGKFVKITY